MDAQNKVALQYQAGTLATAYLYDGQKLVGEVSNTGALKSRYVYGSMDHSPDFMIQNGITYVFIHDHLGSPRYVVRASDGAIMQTLNFEGTDAYGTPPSIANANLQPFRFAGGLSIVGFIDGFVAVKFGARVYDPGSGRWASKDPILFSSSDPNLYGYAVSDPVNFIDPEGLKDMSVIGGPGSAGSISWSWPNIGAIGGAFTRKLSDWEIRKLQENTGEHPHDIKKGLPNPGSWDIYVEPDGRLSIRDKNGNKIDLPYDKEDTKDKKNRCEEE